MFSSSDLLPTVVRWRVIEYLHIVILVGRPCHQNLSLVGFRSFERLSGGPSHKSLVLQSWLGGVVWEGICNHQVRRHRPLKVATQWGGDGESSTATTESTTPTMMDLLPKGFPNAALLMRYEDGKDSSGCHRDNEPDLGFERAILGISLGEDGSERTLEFRKVRDGSLYRKVLLRLGDALMMVGFTIQEDFTHELVKEKVSLLPFPLPPTTILTSR